MLDSNPAKKVKNHFQEKAVTDRKSDERYARFYGILLLNQLSSKLCLGQKLHKIMIVPIIK